MHIGILSDSHGRAKITARAIDELEARGAELLIHLGDVETDAVIDELAGHPVRLVFGNCDWDLSSLTRYARNLEIIVDHPMGRLEIEGKHIAFTHGHLGQLMEEALNDGVDYLLHGHTHELSDTKVGATRVINPGALFRASRYTCALLDPRANALTIIEIPSMNTHD